MINESSCYDNITLSKEHDYTWLDSWLREKNLTRLLEELYFKNVYLKRIEEKQTVATDRMVSRAINSRNVLYKHAGLLLRRYRRLMNYDLDSREAKQLLRNTFIRPERAEVIFELYWAIVIARQFENALYKVIEPGSGLVAKWEHEGLTYELYHDSSAGFRFEEPETIDDLLGRHMANDSVGRGLKALDKSLRMTSIDPKSWRGRPDLVLKTLSKDGVVVAVTVMEVKYTDSKDYALKGLKELLEYVALAREQEEYIEGLGELFVQHVRLKGVLLLGEVPDLQIRSDEDIQVVMFAKNQRIMF
jgi:hypothetical protein